MDMGHPTGPSDSPWILRAANHGAAERAKAQVLLYCFAFAGGSATAYLPWQRSLPSGVGLRAIQLPGRGLRFNEPPSTDFDGIAATLADVVRQDACETPFAFFGHSLGALFAFEVARHLDAAGTVLPGTLFVSGRSGPRYPRMESGLHKLDDDGLIEALRQYNGTPEEILNDRAYMRMLLPAIRADFAMAANYEYRSARPLDVPLTVLAGNEDRHAPEDRALLWQQETRQPIQLHVLPGDHFFILSDPGAVLSLITPQLERLRSCTV